MVPASARLYIGPAYQPINEFLRSISNVKGKWRMELVKNAKLTYAATVKNLYFALQKLCVQQTEPITVYRGVRGVLPRSFWHMDKLRKIHAVDFAFMSTSTDINVSLDYMGENGVGVLWEIECQPEDDVGFHSAADIAVVSQFPAEREFLFPPLTVMDFCVDDLEESRDAEEGPKIKCSDMLPEDLPFHPKVCQTKLGSRYFHIKVKATFM